MMSDAEVKLNYGNTFPKCQTKVPNETKHGIKRRKELCCIRKQFTLIMGTWNSNKTRQ